MGIRSKGNPLSSFSDKSGNTGKEAIGRPHPGGPVVATGGVKFQTPTSMSWASSRTVHFYTEPGTLNITYGASINVVVIGGGGGGGNASGGGGGAGGVAQALNVPTGMPVGKSAYDGQSVTATITIGSGGAAGNNGNPSTFVFAPAANPSTPITITGLGGGAGGLDAPGNDGGSGGGAGYVYNSAQTGGAGNQPSQNSGLPFTVINYGTDGGDVPGQFFDEGGGGGGANNDPVSSTTKDGRSGEAFGFDFPTLNPSPFMTSFPFFPSPLQTTLGPDWDGRTGGIYARLGGGGGAGKPSPNIIINDGGPGGGGDGGADTANGVPGYDYTGGGGGGGGANGGSGGSGGTGIVIVYYT